MDNDNQDVNERLRKKANRKRLRGPKAAKPETTASEKFSDELRETAKRNRRKR